MTKQLNSVQLTDSQLKFIAYALSKLRKIYKKSALVTDAIDIITNALENTEEVYTEQELEENKS